MGYVLFRTICLCYRTSFTFGNGSLLLSIQRTSSCSHYSSSDLPLKFLLQYRSTKNKTTNYHKPSKENMNPVLRHLLKLSRFCFVKLVLEPLESFFLCQCLPVRHQEQEAFVGPGSLGRVSLEKECMSKPQKSCLETDRSRTRACMSWGM